MKPEVFRCTWNLGWQSPSATYFNGSLDNQDSYPLKKRLLWRMASMVLYPVAEPPFPKMHPSQTLPLKFLDVSQPRTDHSRYTSGSKKNFNRSRKHEWLYILLWNKELKASIDSAGKVFLSGTSLCPNWEQDITFAMHPSVIYTKIVLPSRR